MILSCGVVLSALVAVGQGDRAFVREVALTVAAGTEVVAEANGFFHSIYFDSGFPCGGPLFGKASSSSACVATTSAFVPAFSFLIVGRWWGVVPSIILLVFTSLASALSGVRTSIWIGPNCFAPSLALLLYWVADGSACESDADVVSYFAHFPEGVVEGPAVLVDHAADFRPYKAVGL